MPCGSQSAHYCIAQLTQVKSLSSHISAPPTHDIFLQMINDRTGFDRWTFSIKQLKSLADILKKNLLDEVLNSQS